MELIDKRLFLQLREIANATCSNSYLMENGNILTNTQFKALDFWERLECVLLYRYADRKIIKL